VCRTANCWFAHKEKKLPRGYLPSRTLLARSFPETKKKGCLLCRAVFQSYSRPRESQTLCSHMVPEHGARVRFSLDINACLGTRELNSTWVLGVSSVWPQHYFVVSKYEQIQGTFNDAIATILDQSKNASAETFHNYQVIIITGRWCSVSRGRWRPNVARVHSGPVPYALDMWSSVWCSFSPCFEG